MLMRKAKRLRILGALAIAGALAIPSGSAMAAAPTAHPYTCGGGSVPTGTYSTVTITGFCDVVPGATITVTGNLNVAAGALFDAQSAASTITVGGSATSGAHSFLLLGCQPGALVGNTGHPCATTPDEHSMILVKGNVAATDSDAVLLNGITVNGNVSINGGGVDYIPWSIKNNTVKGNLSVSDVTDDWVGVMFNTVSKNVSLTNINVTDPGDPGRLVFVVRNNVAWNLNCSGLLPGVSGGFNPTKHNIVGRQATGQCVGI